MSTQKTETEVVDAAKFGAALSEVRLVGATPFVVVPSDFEVHDLEKHLRNPTRKRGIGRVNDVATFVAMVERYNDSETTVLYGSKSDRPSFTAIFNDHQGRAVAGWRDHGVIYDCPLSREWKTWSEKNKKPMAQADFAQFIEDNTPDCVAPPAADMLEIARTLEAKKAVNFASGIRLSNGEQEFTYEEKVDGSAAKGRLSIPEVFIIGIPVLDGGPRYQVQARLRYRIAEGGKLVLWFDLLRPHVVLEDAVTEVWKDIEAKTGFVIFNGSV